MGWNDEDMGTVIELPQHELTAYRANPPGEVRGAVVGFCFGGSYCLALADDRLQAAVASDVGRRAIAFVERQFAG